MILNPMLQESENFTKLFYDIVRSLPSVYFFYGHISNPVSSLLCNNSAGSDLVPFQSGWLPLSPIYATPGPSRGHQPFFPLYSTPPYLRWPCGHCLSGKPQCPDTDVRHFWLVDSFTGNRLVSQWLCAPSTRTLTFPTSSACSASQKQLF